MSAIRVTGSILLTLALAATVVLAFVPLGSAFTEPANSAQRTTETYFLFHKDVDTTARGEEATGDEGATHYYLDETMTGLDGVKGLRAMGLLVAGAGLLTFVALLLTSLPNVRRGRLGGIFALLALALFALGIVGGALGTQQHAAEQLNAEAAVDPTLTTLAAAGLAVLFLGLAVPLGLTRAGPRRDAEAAMVWGDAPAMERRLRCPDCSTLVAAPAGLVPICPNCQFGSDYVGPAGAPVLGRAIGA